MCYWRKIVHIFYCASYIWNTYSEGFKINLNRIQNTEHQSQVCEFWVGEKICIFGRLLGLWRLKYTTSIIAV